MMTERVRVALRADDAKVKFDPVSRKWAFVRDDNPTDLTEEELDYIQIMVDREAAILAAAR